MSERLHSDDRMHWRVFDLWTQTDRQADRRAGRPGHMQTGKTRREVKPCLLTAKADKLIDLYKLHFELDRNAFRKRAEFDAVENSKNDDENNDSIVTLLKNVLNRLQQTIDRDVFMKRARRLKKRNQQQ